jgi:hypothetical protein
MQFTILRIILDVIVMTSPYPCADWMRDYLPLKPQSPEFVRLDPYEDGGCIIRYRSPELAIPGPEFKGV